MQWNWFLKVQVLIPSVQQTLTQALRPWYRKRIIGIDYVQVGGKKQ
ncbi:hypothetical protein OH492_12420 [Vibrio chagasii]|nr:hypothetical protein [Vibrio chagasii]